VLCRTCDGRVPGGALECANCFTPAGAYALRNGRRTYPLRTAGRVAAAMVGLSTAVAAAAYLAPVVGVLAPGAAGGYARATAEANLVAFLLAAPTVVVWFHRAHRNLHAFTGVEPSIRSWWASWGWFVPVVSLYLPHSVLAEIADHTLWRDRIRYLAPVWWLSWLTGVVLAVVVEVGGTRAGPLTHFWALVLNTVAGSLLVVLMLRISRAQEARIARGAGPPEPIAGLIMTSPVVPVTGRRDRRSVP
jgi:Domain of unknown function (DUF4328)